MKIAIVHDWLDGLGDAEKVLQALLRIYPQAELYTLFDFLTEADRKTIGFGSATTSVLQRLPFVRGRHRAFLPLMPIAVEQFDLSAYDLVISNGSVVAQGVLTGPDQVHISYVHAPARSAWDRRHAGLRRGGHGGRRESWFARLSQHRMRLWDSRTGHGPDAVVASSASVARRVRKVYDRDAAVIHPPVAPSDAAADAPRGAHFLVADRHPAGNVGAVIEAFSALPDLKLVVAGTGSQTGRLRRIAGPNVSFAGVVGDGELRRLMATARALVCAEEDLAVAAVEAQAEGTPVLALGRGAAETVVAATHDRTGLFFESPDPAEIAACVNAFIARESGFSRAACRRQARHFSAERFQAAFARVVAAQMAARLAAVRPDPRAVPRLDAVS